MIGETFTTTNLLNTFHAMQFSGNDNGFSDSMEFNISTGWCILYICEAATSSSCNNVSRNYRRLGMYLNQIHLIL